MTEITENTRRIIEKEDRLLSYTTRVPYYPLVVDRAKGSHVWDVEGNEFIDLLASAAVINVGHNHEKVLEAVHEHVDRFIHYTPAYMYHVPHTKLAEKLVEITPGDFEKRVAFALSGSASVDGAIKAARSYTGRNHIVSFYHSYHGTTIGSLSVSGYGSDMRKGMGSLVPDVHFIPFPDSYRGKRTEECLESFRELITMIVPAESIAAVIYEPIQGDAGILIPEQAFYIEVEKICRENGILLIADEVHTGFGRTGAMFASELFHIDPDIIVLGKAIAAGMPLSAIVGRKEIMEAWHTPVHFFNTAGNPVSCAAATASIEVIEEEHLLENAVTVGNYMMERFKDMMTRHECIGDVRGSGLMIGVDIVKNRESKERDVQTTAKICYRCWEKGVILAFFSGCVLRVEPPLTMTMEEAKDALDIVEASITDVENGLVPDSAVDQVRGL